MFLPMLISRLFGAQRDLFNLSDYLQSPEQFERSAEAERMRVDRNGSLVSLLALRLPRKKSSPADVTKLSLLLESRLRITDTAGQMRDGRIGVLLPDTPETGAWNVANLLCEAYHNKADRPHCEVLVYPDKWDDDSQQRSGEIEQSPSIGATERSTFESLFCQGMPAWKRALDLVVSAAGLIATAPVMLFIAAAIKFTSPGGVFFLQAREGLNGRRFKIYKFRTMQQDAEELKASLRQFSEQDGPAFKLTHDPRTTLIGRVLRKTSLDELPQLINVLRGEMSLVGPRPLPVEESQACQPWQRRRLRVTPGITCFWQVFGRNIVPFDEWIRMDLRYVRERSPWCDIRLVVATPLAVMFGKGPR